MLHRNKTVVGVRAMTSSFLPEIPKIDLEKGPHLFAGAASPLWLMFGGAAMAGATWWWWSARWREAVNLEALLAPSLAKAEPSLEATALSLVELAPEPAVKPVFEPVIDPVAEAPVLAPVELAPALETPAPVTATAEAVAEVAADATQEMLDKTEALVAETTEAAKAAAEPVVEAAVEAAKSAADDLTLLVGIGPKLSASLVELGVTRFSEIAAWGPKELADFDAKLSLKGRAERDAWVAQAKRLASL
jgi:predicted flap endonuclease-1-like 5' DNA nuclease